MKIAEEKAGYTYSHVLMMFETYAKLKRKLLKKQQGEDVKDYRPWYEKMWDCCDISDEELADEVDENAIRNDLKADKDKGRFRVDVYMPEAIEDNVWNFVIGVRGIEILLEDRTIQGRNT